jgi:transcriptional regulator with XRE-family HTH domain
METRLRLLIEKLEVTQSKFAELIGISHPTVARYLSTGHISVEGIKLICAKLNVSRQWLETGEGEMFNNGIAPNLDAMQNVAPSTPWKEEAYTLLKEQLQQSERRYNELMTMFSTFMGKSKSFLKAPQMPLGTTFLGYNQEFSA